MLGLGIDIFKNKPTGVFSFSDVDAANYYMAITAVNGGDIDSNTLYGVDLVTFKQAINTAFVSLKSASIYTKLQKWFPVLGGTDVTHAIDAIALGSDISFVGSPTQNANGIVLNGTTQYVNASFTMGDFTSFKTSNHLMQYHINNAGTFGYGVIQTSSRIWNHSTVSNLTADNVLAGVARITVANTAINGMMVTSRTSTTDHKVYTNGVLKGTATGDVTGSTIATTQNIFFGAYNNSGTTASYLNGTIQNMSIGAGLTETDVTNFNTIVQTLNTTLGR